MALILIVEHEERQARFLTHVLQQAGHTPMLAPNGFAALLGMRAQPDLILLDMGLPDIAGSELLQCLKRQPAKARVPVVAVTDAAESGEPLPQAGAAGAEVLLKKPVSAEALREAVERVLCFRPAWDSAMESREARQRSSLLYRLICNGSDSLVFQVCRRLEVDRARTPGVGPGEPLTWPEIVRRAKREGLLREGEEQALLHASMREPLEMIA